MESHDPELQHPILAAFSPRSAARAPVEFGLAAGRITGAPLVIVTVRHGGPVVHELAGSVDDSAGGDARTLDHLRLDLRRRHVDADVRVREARTVGGGLIEAMKELQPAMVVLGATHRGAVGAALLGTTIEHVIHAATCPVAVVPRGYQRPEEGVQVIGAAFAPTTEGRAALGFAARLARAGGVRLRAISVQDPKHAADEAVVREAVGATAKGVESEVDTVLDDAADGLVAASQHVDLLVMGSRARGARRAVVLGSVSRKVAERSTCPVVILPRGATEAADQLISHAEALGSS
jgi:nucleotide-binding universal stress UspA family protein